ncbi:hypothetical protein [Streptomyces sp. NBC_01530]|uniref:hypothetical protein n=1 Tax=Streptomyces sp. NBC_01530 TaxID=2903895 RepID=UPI00386538AF
MPPTPPDLGCARPAVRASAVVNEEIRALVARAGGWLYGDTRARYEVLRDEWTVAVAAERGRAIEVDVAA